MTPAALPPDLALAYLRALSVDIREAVVADATGTVLAGDAALLAAPDGAGVHRAADAAHVVAVRAGRHAMAAVVAADLRAVLGALGPTR